MDQTFSFQYNCFSFYAYAGFDSFRLQVQYMLYGNSSTTTRFLAGTVSLLYVVRHTQFIVFNLTHSHVITHKSRYSNVLYTQYDDIMTSAFECIMYCSQVVHSICVVTLCNLKNVGDDWRGGGGGEVIVVKIRYLVYRFDVRLCLKA